MYIYHIFYICTFWGDMILVHVHADVNLQFVIIELADLHPVRYFHIRDKKY